MRLLQHKHFARARFSVATKATRGNVTRIAVALGAMATVGALACSDGMTHPWAANSAEDEFRMSGVLVSSLMRADGAADTPVSTLSMNAATSGADPQLIAEAPTRIAADPIEANALRTRAVLPPTLSIGGMSPSFSRSGAGRQPIMRPHAKGRSFKNHKDGKDIELQFVDDPRGGDRPPVAMVTLVNGRAAAVNQYTYTKIGKSWTPTLSRATIFDSTGRSMLVSTNRFSSTTLSAATLNDAANENGGIGARSLLAAVGKLVQPDVLYAETLTDDADASCFKENITMSVASAAYGTALAALVLAWGACVTTIIDCPAVLAAQAALALADVSLGVASASYYQCVQKQQQQQQQQPAAPSGGAGGGSTSSPSGGSGSCYAVDWEVSYDDGASWDYYDTTIIC